MKKKLLSWSFTLCESCSRLTGIVHRLSFRVNGNRLTSWWGINARGGEYCGTFTYSTGSILHSDDSSGIVFGQQTVAITAWNGGSNFIRVNRNCAWRKWNVCCNDRTFSLRISLTKTFKVLLFSLFFYNQYYLFCRIIFMIIFITARVISFFILCSFLQTTHHVLNKYLHYL